MTKSGLVGSVRIGSDSRVTESKTSVLGRVRSLDPVAYRR